MVRIGFVRRIESLPPGCSWILFQEGPETGTGLHHGLRAWERNRRHYTVLEARIPPLVGAEIWAPELAAVLKGLGWNNWALDTDSLKRAQAGSHKSCLETFGRSFWAWYEAESVVFIQVGDLRSTLEHVVRDWMKTFGHVHIDPQHDLESEENRMHLLEHERSSKPGFLKRLLPGKAMFRRKGNL